VDPGTEAAEIGRRSQAFLEGVLSMGVLMLPFNLPGTPYSRWLKDCSDYEQALRRIIADGRAHPGEPATSSRR
jgi:hypothetical protein